MVTPRSIVIKESVVVVVERNVCVLSVELVMVKPNSPESNNPSVRVAFFTMVSEAGESFVLLNMQ